MFLEDHAEKLITATEIHKRVWLPPRPTKQSVRVLMHRIRSKMENVLFLKTLRNRGYYMTPEYRESLIKEIEEWDGSFGENETAEGK